jgi:hypothetical protein
MLHGICALAFVCSRPFDESSANEALWRRQTISSGDLFKFSIHLASILVARYEWATVNDRDGNTANEDTPVIQIQTEKKNEKLTVSSYLWM